MSDEILSCRISPNYLEVFPEPSVLRHCDCTSYSYLLMSMVLLILGTSITVSALGDSDYYLFTSMFTNLGHMWLVGPICISCGTVVAIKSFLYLRRKSVIKMLMRQRAILMSLHEITQQPLQNRETSNEAVYTVGLGSTLTLPPSYDQIALQEEHPPPSYSEAMRLMEIDGVTQPA